MKSEFDDIFDALDFSNSEREIFLRCIDSIRSAPEEDKDPVSEVMAIVKGLSANAI